MNTLAKNIRKYRLARNLGQEDVAEMLGYKSYTTIQKWESGISEPSISKLHELATIFNVSINNLVKGDVEEDSYYLDPEVAQMAQELQSDPELRLLFNASRKVAKEDVEKVKALLELMKKEENGG